MSEATDYLPAGFTPSEEEMFQKGECETCSIKVFEGVRAWGHEHVRDTGHAVSLYYGYDIRDENWLDRLPYERLAEIELTRGAARPRRRPK